MLIVILCARGMYLATTLLGQNINKQHEVCRTCRAFLISLVIYIVTQGQHYNHAQNQTHTLFEDTTTCIDNTPFYCPSLWPSLLHTAMYGPPFVRQKKVHQMGLHRQKSGTKESMTSGIRGSQCLGLGLLCSSDQRREGLSKLSPYRNCITDNRPEQIVIISTCRS